MKTNNPSTRPLIWRSLTLRIIATIILPLTLLSMGIAVGSVLYHQWDMSKHLTEEAYHIATDPALEITLFAPLVLIPPLLFSVAALWVTAKQIIQPLQELEQKAAALAWGDTGLHDYVGAITAAQEEERLRLARELHDDTIQAVIALKQRLQLARKVVKTQSGKQALGELEALSEQTIENLRRLTRALRPIYLEDLGLVTALEMLTREISQAHSLRHFAYSKSRHDVTDWVVV